MSVRLPGGALVRVVPTRTGIDGSLGIPDNLRRAGWWRGGARVGDPFGSMLVAAHVDAVDRGLGPFVALLSVRRGAGITVTSRHLHQQFRVTARRLIDRDRLARAKWVSSYSGAPRLTLVTCAPPYVRSKGGYQRLAVVVASPVGPPPRAQAADAQSLRSRTQRTEWSWSLRSTSVARERVGFTFCSRLGPLISSQMRLASATASSCESEA